MKTNRIDNIIEALGRHEDPKSIQILEEIGTNSEIDEIREKTAHALIRKNSPRSFESCYCSSGKGINDPFCKSSKSAINEILGLNDKTEVLKVLEETMNSEEKTEVKDTARSVKALITYSM